jgi:hypothetical protein
MMSFDLEHALTELARSVPVGDDSFAADGMATTIRRMSTHVRRRRAARRAGTSVVGAAAVAAIAVGGSAIKTHNAAASGPSTALSKRAGAECGKPFDPAGKADPNVTLFAHAFGVGYSVNSNYQYLRLGIQLGDNATQTELDPMPSVSPETAVILQDGVVVGITKTTPWWQLSSQEAPAPDNAASTPDMVAYIPVTETMNCKGIVPSPVKDAMFDVVLLRDVAVPGQSTTTLVASAPVRAPHDSSTSLPGTTGTVDLANSNLDLGVEIKGDWRIFVFSVSDQSAVWFAFKLDDYLAVKDTPGASVPLYGAPTGPDPSYTLSTGVLKASATGDGSLLITFDGVRYGEVQETRMGL